MLVSLLALVGTAFACDPKALTTALTEASPGPSAQAFVDLAACDAAAATAAAPAAVQRMLAGTTGNAAALVALSLGQGVAVRSWLSALEADERASTLNHLGESCAKPGVTTFWTESASGMGEKFWTSRWYAALDACRVPEAQALLTTQLTASKSDRAMFSAVLGTYATNAGVGSIPVIEALAATETDPLVFIDLVRAMPAAGGVGSPSGPDQDRLKAAIAALDGMAPRLPERAFPEARKAYLSLGDELSADQLVAIRYKSLLQDGKLLYGVIALETAVCKKGDTRLWFHAVPVWDNGHSWPDQLSERAQPNAVTIFEPTLAETCKGTGTVDWIVPEAPFESMTAYTGWVAAEKAIVERKHPGVTIKMDLETTAISD